jgi:hypothetical protein
MWETAYLQAAMGEDKFTFEQSIESRLTSKMRLWKAKDTVYGNSS